MTYEESVAELMKAAGDYANTRNAHDLEETISRRHIAHIKDEIDKSIAELSLASESIKIYVERGVFVVEAFNLKSKTWDLIYDVDLLDPPRNSRSFIDFLDRAFKNFLNSYTYCSNIKMKDIQHFCSYANLILNGISSEFTSNLSSLGKELRKTNEKLTEEGKKYDKYCRDLKKAMYKTAELWLAETTIKPGMKLSIKDLRFAKGKTDVRTVKKVKRTNENLSITFNETATAIKDIARIDALETWLINNPQFLEMAKVLDYSKLAK